MAAAASASSESGASVVRTYDQELKFIKQITDHEFRIQKGFVPGMNVSPGPESTRPDTASLGATAHDQRLQGMLTDEVGAGIAVLPPV